MKLFLFDVDGTIAESGQKINSEIKKILDETKLKSDIEIGIVGGGKYEKIQEQLNGLTVHHLFSESGCVYHKNNIEIFRKNIRKHNLYSKINIIIKTSLRYLSEVDYEITGNFIDLRSGIIYISLIGMVATQSEREKFINLDAKNNYREKLIIILKEKAKELRIDNELDILEGGSVGIGIYPKEWDKEQVLENLDEKIYKEIYYFGDKYTEKGNDYKLLNNKRVFGFKVDSHNDTLFYLKKFLC